MGFFDWFRRQPDERRANYTEQALQFRADTIIGRRNLAELTGTVQTCIGLWEAGLAQAETSLDVLTPEVLGMAGRSLGYSGEALFVMRGDELVAANSWTVATKGSKPVAYRVTVPDVGGGRSDTVLAGEVLHFKIGSPVERPWSGTSPLQRASLTAEMLYAVEDALADVFTNAPLGTKVVATPERPNTDNTKIERTFTGKRGRIALEESANVDAAGGPAPAQDWKPASLSPELDKSNTTDTLKAARASVMAAYGVLPSLVNENVTGPAVREAQRHLAQWMLQPIARMIANEAARKFETTADIDVLQPLQAYDAGGRARSLSGVIQGLALAKESGLSDEQIQAALFFSGVTTNMRQSAASAEPPGT